MAEKPSEKSAKRMPLKAVAKEAPAQVATATESKGSEPVKLLSGGNPQIAKGYGDAPVRALAQLETLMVPRPDTAHSLLIEVLATMIEKYESREYPIPEITPSEMLAKLLKTKGVKPAEVSKTTGIPTATLSNVLADRRGISKQNAFRLGEYFGLSPIVFPGRQPRKKAAAG